MKLTAVAQKLLVIEVTEIETLSTRVGRGLENRKVEIKADLVERVRGEHLGRHFRQRSVKHTVTDEAEAAKDLPKDILRLFSRNDGGLPYQVSACREGCRYLIVYANGEQFFLEVPEDDEKWSEDFKPLEAKAPGLKASDLQRWAEQWAEQVSARQPATALDSKAEDNERPKLQSEERSN